MHIYITKFYSVLKKMKFLGRWVGLESILREVTQTPKDKCCLFSVT